MKPETMETRLAEVAILFGPPVAVSRQEASSIHSAICDALCRDDIMFAYQNPGAESDEGAFRAQMRRKSGREVLQILLENEGPKKPLRLVIAQSWPDPETDPMSRCDEIAKAVFDRLPPESLHRVVVETRIRAQAEVEAESADGFLTAQMSNPPCWFTSASPPDSGSLKYRWRGRTDDASSPARDLHVEPLAGAPTQVYLELISRWVVRPGSERKLTEPPSHFLQDSHEFLRGRGTQAAQSKPVRASKSRIKKKHSGPVDAN